MKDLIKELVALYGPVGVEVEVRDAIYALVEPHVDDMRTDEMGNLYARRRGNGDGRRIMLAAHMDEIGVIVTKVEPSGLLRFSPVGVAPFKSLLGMRVCFADGTVGVISLDGGAKAELSGTRIPTIEEWFIDTGVSDVDALNVGIGAVAVFIRPYVDLGERIMAGALDDRVGCAILVDVLRRLETSTHDITFVFTTQEEVGARGARVATYAVDPEIAVAVDVTAAADTPKQKLPGSVRLGRGPAIRAADIAMIGHPRLTQALIDTAEGHNIPHQVEVAMVGSTDAAIMQQVRGGVIAGALGVPCRYTHTPGEMVDIGDVQNTTRLLLALLASPLDQV